MIVGSHSTGKSSFVNWFFGDTIQKVSAAIETSKFTFITTGRKRQSLDGAATVRLFNFLEEFDCSFEDESGYSTVFFGDEWFDEVFEYSTVFFGDGLFENDSEDSLNFFVSWDFDEFEYSTVFFGDELFEDEFEDSLNFFVGWGFDEFEYSAVFLTCCSFEDESEDSDNFFVDDWFDDVFECSTDFLDCCWFKDNNSLGFFGEEWLEDEFKDSTDFFDGEWLNDASRDLIDCFCFDDISEEVIDLEEDKTVEDFLDLFFDIILLEIFTFGEFFEGITGDWAIGSICFFDRYELLDLFEETHTNSCDLLFFPDDFEDLFNFSDICELALGE